MVATAAVISQGVFSTTCVSGRLGEGGEGGEGGGRGVGNF